MLKSKDERFPRLAFAKDLSKEIDRAIASGDRVIVMLDANMDIRHSIIQEHLQKAHLKEALIDKYRTMNKLTFKRNHKDIPIDGVWISEGLQILQGGHLSFDEIIPNTDHCCLWLDIHFTNAFGHIMPMLNTPITQRLHCRDPRIVKNFVSMYEKLEKQNKLREKV
jgi:hypothetical protein